MHFSLSRVMITTLVTKVQSGGRPKSLWTNDKWGLDDFGVFGEKRCICLRLLELLPIGYADSGQRCHLSKGTATSPRGARRWGRSISLRGDPLSSHINSRSGSELSYQFPSSAPQSHFDHRQAPVPNQAQPTTR